MYCKWIFDISKQYSSASFASSNSVYFLCTLNIYVRQASRHHFRKRRISARASAGDFVLTQRYWTDGVAMPVATAMLSWTGHPMFVKVCIGICISGTVTLLLDEKGDSEVQYILRFSTSVASAKPSWALLQGVWEGVQGYYRACVTS